MKARIGTYEVRERLGAGGIGQVYEAVDTMLGRPVAIKALRAEFSQDPVFVERFRAEASNLARLLHPNIATLFALHPEGDELFMVMELVRGHTLESLIERTGGMATDDCLAVLGQAVAGMASAHRMGLIHRDIKPANLMVTDSGLVKIMDFGIARLRGSHRMTRQGEMVGTLSYMAPEQLKGGEGDERSDIYSLAIVVYEMLSGHVPFSAASEYELIRAQVEQPPPPLRSVGATVGAALMRALAKKPEDRFASVNEFGRAIGTGAIADAEDVVCRMYGRAFAASAPQPTRIRAVADFDARPAAPAAPRPRPTRLKPILALGTAVLVLLGVAGYIAYDSSKSAPPAQVEAKAPAPVPAPAPAPAPVVAAAPPPVHAPGHGQPPGETVPPPPDLPPIVAPAPAAAPAVPAPKSKPAPTTAPGMAPIDGIIQDVWDNSTFTLGTKHVQLFGINAAQGPAGILETVLQSNGNRAVCYPQAIKTLTSAQGHQREIYTARCVTRQGTDLGLLVLTEGGARSLDVAPPEYRNAELLARRRGKGMWSSMKD